MRKFFLRCDFERKRPKIVTLSNFFGPEKNSVTNILKYKFIEKIKCLIFSTNSRQKNCIKSCMLCN